MASTRSSSASAETSTASAPRSGCQPTLRRVHLGLPQPAPELWDLYGAATGSSDHVRVHPILRWRRSTSELRRARADPGAVPLLRQRGRRFRSIGCRTCCSPVASSAATLTAIRDEVRDAIEASAQAAPRTRRMRQRCRSCAPSGTCEDRRVSASMLAVAMVGEVDHGKSTLLGRLLHDTASLRVIPPPWPSRRTDRASTTPSSSMVSRRSAASCSPSTLHRASSRWATVILPSSTFPVTPSCCATP